MDFDKPENEGLSGARNFYISTDLKVEVGVWHILPQGNFLWAVDNKTVRRKGISICIRTYVPGWYVLFSVTQFIRKQ